MECPDAPSDARNGVLGLIATATGAGIVAETELNSQTRGEEKKWFHFLEK
jgi:hypothetical protein